MSAPEVGPEAVVAFVPDLMDRSKVRARFPGATLVPTAAKLAEAVGRAAEAGGSVLVIVDLGRPGVLDAVRELRWHRRAAATVGFASRVDETTLTTARDVGVEALPRSVFFRRLGQGDLVPATRRASRRPRRRSRRDSTSIRRRRGRSDSTSIRRQGIVGRGPGEQRALLERTAEMAADHLEGLDERPVGAAASADDLRRALGGPLPEEPADPARRRRGARRRGGRAGPRGDERAPLLRVRHRRHLAGGAGGRLADQPWDQNAGLGVMLTGRRGRRGGRRLAGCSSCSGCRARRAFGFVTGGQMANFTGLAAARHACWRARAGTSRRTGWPARRRSGWSSAPRGTPPIDGAPLPRPRAAGSRSWRSTARGGCAPTPSATRSTASAGPDDRLRPGRQRQHRRLRPVPEIVDVAHASTAPGSTSTAPSGCGRRPAPARAPRSTGIEPADSWATDGHKWLNVPYDSGFAFVRDPEAHRRRDGLTAAYLSAPTRAAGGMDWAPGVVAAGPRLPDVRGAPGARARRRRRARGARLPPGRPVAERLRAAGVGCSTTSC